MFEAMRALSGNKRTNLFISHHHTDWIRIFAVIDVLFFILNMSQIVIEEMAAEALE